MVVSSPKSQSLESLTHVDTLYDFSTYVLLPEKKHGDYEYPNMLVAMQLRRCLVSFADAQRAVQRLGAVLLTVRQYADLLRLVTSGEPIYNGMQQPLSPEQEKILRDQILSPPQGRGELLDGYFFMNGGQMFLASHRLQHSKPHLDSSLVTGHYQRDDLPASLSLHAWLSTATLQGLPGQNAETIHLPGDKLPLYYWSPQDNAAMLFCAGSGGLTLSCRYPVNAALKQTVRLAFPL